MSTYPHADDHDVAGAMNAARIWVLRQYLGLDPQGLSDALGINERSIRRYEMGTATMNPAVADRLEDLVRVADAQVEAMIAELADQVEPVILVYREDGQMHAVAPQDAMPISAGWHRAIVARVLAAVPHAVVDYPPKREA